MIKSKNPSKQRKAVYNAPLHRRQKMMAVHLSKDLRSQFNFRCIPVRKGDEVAVVRGKFKKKTGKVAKVSLKKLRVYIDGITRKKVNGTEVQVPFHPSNLMITNLDLTDKRRQKIVQRKQQQETKVQEIKSKV